MGALKQGIKIAIICEERDTAERFIKTNFNKADDSITAGHFVLEYRYNNGDTVSWIPTHNLKQRTRGKRYDIIFFNCDDREIFKEINYLVLNPCTWVVPSLVLKSKETKPKIKIIFKNGSDIEVVKTKDISRRSSQGRKIQYLLKPSELKSYFEED